MDTFSNSVLADIVNSFPEFQNRHNPTSDFLELDIPSKDNSQFGGLVIQTTADKDIWIRNYQKYSAYSVDSTAELINIVKGTIADDIFWVIGIKDNEWVETTLVKNDSDIETEKGVTYNLFSWSGKFDKVILVE